MIQKVKSSQPSPAPLAEVADKVQTREDFIAFVRALLADHRQNADAWENRFLETYLEALAGWTEDMEGYHRNRNEATPAQPSWRNLAEMLLAARTYE
jgi:hypothetical protein